MTKKKSEGRCKTIQKWRWSKGLMTIFMATLLITTGLYAWADCSYYYHLKPSDNDLKNAVASIKSGYEDGTAFLIDDERGLLLTASHVVKSSIDNPSTPVYGRFRGSGTEKFNLSVVAHDTELDVALLRAEDLEQFKNRKELELSFHFPEQQNVIILGGATGTIESPEVLSKKATEFSIQSQNSFSITADVAEGDSGAPVIKESDGMVIGIVTQKTPKTGVAVPVNAMTGFLLKQSKIKISQELTEFIDNPSRKTEEELVDVFRAGSAKKFSNFELVGMISSMRENWEEKKRGMLPNEIKDCNTHTIAVSRHMGVFTSDVVLLTQDFSSIMPKLNDESAVKRDLEMTAIEIYYNEKNFEEVLKHVEELKKLGGSLSPEALDYQWQAFKHLERYEEAKEALNEYLQITRYSQKKYPYSERLKQQVKINEKLKEDDKAFEQAKSKGTVEAFNEYLDKYPKGKNFGNATQLLKQTRDDEAFEQARSVGTSAAYRVYLSKIDKDESQHVEKARELQAIAREKEVYEQAKSIANAEAYDIYLSNYSNGQYTQEFVLLHDDSMFNQAKSKGTKEAYLNYLFRYPEGIHKVDAQRFMNEVIDNEAFEVAKSIGTSTAFGVYLCKVVVDKRGSIYSSVLPERICPAFPERPKIVGEVQNAWLKALERDKCKTRLLEDINSFCPAILPEINCPAFPERPNTPREFVIAWSKVLERDKCKTQLLEGINTLYKKFDKERGRHVEKARRLQAMAQEKEVYEQAKSIGTFAAYEVYLISFPNGQYFDEAKNMMLELNKEHSLQELPKYDKTIGPEDTNQD